MTFFASKGGAHGARGQTIIETLIALPVMLVVLFAIVYVARIGVVNERAQLALRYGGIAGFDAQSGAYSAADIYSNLTPTANPSPCPGPALGAFNNSAPFPGPTSAPFWQPDKNEAASGTCQAQFFGLGGAQFLASHYFTATAVSVSAGIDVPQYIRAALGETSQTTNSSGTFVHAAFPGAILYCSTEVRDRVYGAITASGSSIPPTPIPIGATPSPAPNNNGACR